MSRRIQILRRATEVFERQGVNRTSIEDIANAVGIKREAIYYYFKSRADILLRIILPQSTSLVTALDLILGSNLSAPEKLEAAIRAHLDRFNPSYLEMSVALREDHFLEDEGKAAELRNVWNEYTRLWTRLIVEGQEQGMFNPALDAKIVANGILGMCNWMSRWYDPAKSKPVEEIMDIFTTMVSHGIVTPAATTPVPAKKPRRSRKKVDEA
jgi:AcrR family transcriptional regulator